jgi:molybdenum cofactor biosynthesis enzyme MoaA
MVKELFANLGKDYKYTLNAMPRGKDEHKAINFACNIPHKVVSIDDNLNCILCICDGWLPIPVGQVQDFTSLPEIFSSPKAKILQADVDAKNYTWCAVQNCGIKHEDIIRSSYTLVINIDRSCNLQCPSCRRDKFILTSGPLYDQKIVAANQILNWLDQLDEKIDIVTSGDGDPLASLVMRPLIKNWKFKPKQRITIKTNGMLIKKQLQNTEMLRSANFSISIDAGSKDVFEKVRLGGNWKILLDNFNFLVENNKQRVTALNFTLQKDNFRDLENFVKLCEHYQFRGTVSKLTDWGTWNLQDVLQPDEWTQKNGYFYEHDVLQLEHANYKEAVSISNKFLDHPLVLIDSSVREKLHEAK